MEFKSLKSIAFVLVAGFAQVCCASQMTEYEEKMAGARNNGVQGPILSGSTGTNPERKMPALPSLTSESKISGACSRAG